MDITTDKIDIHSHILYGIDDGSKSLEESIEIIKQAIKVGFKEIVLTPHFIENSKYKASKSEKESILKNIKDELEKQNININLYLGNEVFVDNYEELLDKEISFINDSKYILIEFPMNHKPKDINNIIYELKIKGIIPIIAHPERYDYVEKDINIAKEWIEEGAILQSNYGSIIGIYGSGPQKTAKKLLKNNLIDLLSSDVHYPNNKIYSNMDKIEKKLKKIVGENYNSLVYTNPKLIIENKEISRNY
jgi:protein-tyrosine phosphatase